ncbi:MAG: aldehyde dehydrogenase family protein [Myxococcales bacterium]|nr:aldehyde dehydrogenase family protein [Myxococcales bacterium]
MSIAHEPAGPTTASARDLDYRELVDHVRRRFESGRTKSLDWRREQLRALKRMLKEREADISEALAADLGKPPLEGYATEIGYSAGSIEHMLKHLDEWTTPRKVSTPLVTQPGSSRIYKEPLGVVLIIAPWNYPFQLAVAPLAAALAAGNCAVVKPSEVAAETSALLAQLLPQYLDQAAVKVVEGGVPETTALLEQRFDHIFYTGNGKVGRIIMAAAAKHLTPVTLELGGKSPCIIDESANLDIAVKRIAWGKWTNCGQTCIAPDYVLVHRDRHDAFVRKLSRTVVDFWGDDAQQSKDYGRIINERHHRRLMKLMECGKVAVGGRADEADRFIAPTVLTGIELDSPIMQEEIFGPILPVIAVDDIDAAIRIVNQGDKPLALYIFTENDASAEKVLQETSSGGATVNHVVLHYAVHDLPFGGVGESGMGAYHGKYGFDTFTHEKAVLKKGTGLDPALMYPPYSSFSEKILRKVT